MSRTAVLFPGQGSHTDGMRDLVERARPDLLKIACEAVGDDPFARVSDGTQFAQPAIFCAGVAAWSERAPEAHVLAGHSLGELTALVAAGSIGEPDGVALVVARGRAMQAAATAGGGEGAMLAVLKGSPEAAQQLADEFSVSVANDNAPGEVVLAGDAPALDAAARAARGRGLRAIRLPVAGAFHSPAMEPAVAEYRRALDAVPIAEPRTPVYCSTTAEPFERNEIAALLAGALTSPVRWRDTLLALERAAVRRFVDAGPGHVVAGLARRTMPHADVVALESLEGSLA